MEKENNTRNILNSVTIRYAKKYGLSILLYILFDLALLFIGIINPRISGEYINALVNHAIYETVIHYVVLVIIISLINIIFYYLARLSQKKLSLHLKYAIEKEIYLNLKEKQINELQKSDASFPTQKIMQSTDIFVDFWISFLNVCIKIVQTIIIIILLYQINYKVFSVLALMILLYVIIYLLLKRQIFKSNYTVQNINNELYKEIKQQIDNIKTIRCLSVFSFFEKRLNKKYIQFIKISISNNILITIFLSVNLIINKAATIVVFFYGGMQVIAGSLSVGYYTILMSYFNSVLDGISTFFVFANQFEKYEAAKKRIEEILAIPNEKDGEICVGELNSIKVNNLSYTISRKIVIENFSYSFNKGYIYCIKGKNGTGKSTFIDIFLGLISGYSGEIVVDGYELANINKSYYRKQYISALLQSTFLFDGSMKENIFFDNQVRDKKLCNLLDALGFNEFWAEKGINYIINEKNSNLSGGERQKILLLRTLYKESALLILDEPTSWLDNVSCYKLCEQLKREKKDRITIFVTHDKVLEEIADYVILF